MEAILSVHSGECYTHNWSLDISLSNGNKKSFYLGQDVKFCSRVLGMQPDEVIKITGIRELEKKDEDNRKRMANFIIDELELDEEKLEGLQAWELCCQ